ncbi:MAG: ABC transporter permease [Gemmatimonadetes bacterium]|nr:ABC transporter permease [Gemmatimonadota bacterium]
MNVWEGVRLAMQQIRTQKMKSVFSLLGVILGITFLITVVTAIEGIDRYMREEVTSQIFGINTLTVRRFPDDLSSDESVVRRRQRFPRLRTREADAIREELAVSALVAIESDASSEVVADNGRTASNVRLVGSSPEAFAIRSLDVARGRVFGDQEAQRGLPVAVVGKETAEVLYPQEEAVGRRIRLRGTPYRIIGVLEERGSLFGQSLDNFVYVPATSPLQRWLNPLGVVDEIIVQPLDPNDVALTQSEVEGIMRVQRRLRPFEESNFAVETSEDAISFWNDISRVLFTALPGLVSISLVVGGIVIMNIMLVSVMERTREIGVRKALGARRRDILTQVLIESVTLTTVGAGLGVAMGIGIAMLAAALSPLPAAISPLWVTIGVVLGIAVGIASGVYPAARAARMNPVDALRYE